MASKISFLVVLCVVVVVVGVCLPQTTEAAGAGCPKLVPVPIDDNFLFKKQPPNGFYPAFASGEDSMPKYTAKKVDPKGVAGPRAVCVKAKLTVNGQEVLTGPPITCTYNHSPSSVFCDMSKTGGGAAAAISATGLNIPKATLGYMVDTDNKTFVAYATCMDGAVYTWMILSTQPKLKKVHARTLTSLGIDKKVLEESRNKKYKPGVTKISEGACASGGGAGAVAGKVGEGLGNLFSG